MSAKRFNHITAWLKFIIFINVIEDKNLYSFCLLYNGAIIAVPQVLYVYVATY